MREVAIIGIGQTPVREHWDRSLWELAVEAVWEALTDAERETVEALYVGNMLSGPLADQEHLGALVADQAGLQGVEAVKVEAACASAAAAFRQAVMAVASGMVDSAVAVGVEKLTERSGTHTTHGLATAADADYETALGLTFVALNALLMRRYMHVYHYDREDFAPFVIQAHQNAVHNPRALFRHPITLEQYRRAKMIADPICLLDSSPIGDGAAAVVVVPAERRKRALRVQACEVATDTVALHDRRDPLWLTAVERSTARALQTAGVDHRQIDLFELHDAFSIMSVLSLEAAGFAERGTAPRLANEGTLAVTGRLPVATFGGLKGRGHPVGATGLYQIVEACRQLRGEAPEAIQVPEARRAMTQNIGGSGATVVTTVLEIA